MDCLGYAAQEGTPMFSARLGADGPGLLFVGSTSGNTLGQFLEAAVAYLGGRGLPGDKLSECRDKALALLEILTSESEGPDTD